MRNIKVIGVGGIGGMLVESLCRYVQYSKGDAYDIGLIDGDRFEVKNDVRQEVGAGLGLHKAKMWMRRLANKFRLRISAHCVYVQPDNIAQLIHSEEIVFLCVDNHATRKLVQDHCEKLRDIVLISGGNDFHDGNVQIFIKRNGRKQTPLITQYHPEIADPHDKRPDELGCDEAVTDSPQLLFANMMAATLMLNAFYAIQHNQLDYNEVYFDIIQNKTETKNRR